MPVVSYLPTEILDYVSTHAPPEGSPFGISQRELAKALGYHPCSMSRPLAELVREGSLRTRRGVVRGGIRKQFVYSLTDAGRTRLVRETRSVPLLSGALPPPPNPFIGRREELRDLQSYSSEGGVVIFVEGPAGMGKTALVARHVRRLKAGRVPFWFPVRAASSPRHFTLSLAHALSTLEARQIAYYAQLPREPVGREVADLANRALGERPFLAVLDDAQNASADLRRFLGEFSEGLLKGRSDVLVIVGQEPRIFEPNSVPTYHLSLGGLDRSAAHELTDRKGGLADRFESVYQASLGNPLLLQLAVSNPGVEATPAALSTAILDRMPRGEVDAFVPLALAHEPLPLSFLAEITKLSNERISQLVQSGILLRSPEDRVELAQVVRAAFVARVERLQERDARLLLARFYGRSRRPEAVRERFVHLVSAEAWRFADEILDRQRRTLFSLGYSDSLRNSLRHLSLSTPSESGRIRALRAEATLLRVHSEYSEAILCLRRAIVEARGDKRTEAECLLETADLHIRLQQIAEAERTLEEVREQGPFARRIQLQIDFIAGRLVESKGDLPRARELFYEVYKASRAAHSADLTLDSLARWSNLASLGGDREGALRVIEEGLAEARRAGRMDVVFNLMSTRARAYLELGRVELADAELRMIKGEAEALGYLSQLAYTLSGLSALAAEGGHWASASSYAKQAIALAERIGSDTVLGHTLAVLCAGEERQGLLAEARQHGERSVAVLSRLPPSDSLLLARAYLCQVYVKQSDVTKASEQYREALRLAEGMGMSWWKSQIESELKPQLQALGGLA